MSIKSFIQDLKILKECRDLEKSRGIRMSNRPKREAEIQGASKNKVAQNIKQAFLGKLR